jgi:hypothetical protein
VSTSSSSSSNPAYVDVQCLPKNAQTWAKVRAAAHITRRAECAQEKKVKEGFEKISSMKEGKASTNLSFRQSIIETSPNKRLKGKKKLRFKKDQCTKMLRILSDPSPTAIFREVYALGKVCKNVTYSMKLMHLQPYKILTKKNQAIKTIK